VRREIFRDLKTDSFIGPGDQGDVLVPQSDLLFFIDVCYLRASKSFETKIGSVPANLIKAVTFCTQAVTPR
jgi:hypothetical protein